MLHNTAIIPDTGERIAKKNFKMIHPDQSGCVSELPRKCEIPIFITCVRIANKTLILF